MRRIAYIAGPYAGADLAEIERNVRRACALGRWAAERGYAPIVPHAIGWMGCHGARDDSSPGVREAALDSGIALATNVGHAPGSLLLVIERDDGTLSAGTRLEVDAWHDGRRFVRRDPGEIERRAWWEWVNDCGVEDVP